MPRHDSFTSYFTEKILPVLLIPALTAVFIIITLYFTVGTLGNRVQALEDNSIRKDVLEPQLTEINKKLDSMDGKIDRLSERR